MKNTLTMLTVFVMSFFALAGFAQNQQGKISGIVSDESKKPIESATISILKAADSTVAKTAVSDKTGKFQIENINQGKYLVSVSAVGHTTFYSAVVELSSSNSSIDLNNISLPAQSKNLQQVEVVAKKPFFEQKADKMVVNVDAAPSNAGSSVMDVLEKSPGVAVDKDGNISLKGKQGVVIMIDNKPTYLSATDLANYLKSLPASAIDQLEIMTNPSAKYDAAGNSGIINIKTKKNKAKGFNGSVTLTHTQGVYPKPSGSLNLNYRTGKVNLFLNGGYTHWEGFQDLDINRQYYTNGGANKVLNAIFTQHTAMKFT